MKHLPLVFIILCGLFHSLVLGNTGTVALECTCEYNMGELSSSLSEAERDNRCFRLAVPSEEWDASHEVNCPPGGEACRCVGLMGVRGVGANSLDAQSNARDTCRTLALEAAESVQVTECKDVSS